MITPSQLAQLWTQHAAGLRLLARVRSDLADDCVQEAFVRLSQQVVMPDDPLAWLVRVVRNCALVEIRSEKRRKAREEHWQQKSKPWLASHSKSIDSPSPEEAEQALRLLAPDLRELVVAVIWTGMTFRQVAEAFDIPTATAHRRFREAMEELRRLLISQQTSIQTGDSSEARTKAEQD